MTPADETSARVTIGVMARAPVAGRCKTRLAKRLGFDGAAALYRAMLADRLDAVSALPACRRVVMAAPEDDGASILRALAPPGWEIIEQRGPDLGARLANAFRALLAGGVVHLVDSDSPTLPLRDLWRELAAPRPVESVVLGPCEDGGYYSIGMRALAPRVFQDIPWSTEVVAAVTRARCAEAERMVVDLPSWYDVDDADDLDRLARELHASPSLAPRTAAFVRETIR